MVRRIKCNRCGVCAKTTKGLRITAKEAMAIGNKIKLQKIKHSQYAARIPVNKKGVCVALEVKGSKGRCQIYRVRPDKCKQYPLVYFGGRAIIQRDCMAVKELLADGKRYLNREELEKIPFLAKSLKALEKAAPKVKKQQSFEITNA